MCGWSYVPLSPLITDQHSRNRGGTHSQTRVSGDGEDSCRLENGVRWSALVTLVSVRARYGLCNERIEYCVPLARAGTQYNATTCPARAGLIPRPAPTHWGRGTISACAERSRRPVEQVRVERDHLRVCGADQYS